MRPAQAGCLGPARAPGPAGGLHGRRHQQQRPGRGAVHQQVAAAQRGCRVGRRQRQHHVGDRPGQQADQGGPQEHAAVRARQPRPAGPPPAAGTAQPGGQRGHRGQRRYQQAYLHQVAEAARVRRVLGQRAGQHRAGPAGGGGRGGGQERRAGRPAARLGQHQARGQRPGAGADGQSLHRPPGVQPGRPARRGQQGRAARRGDQPGGQHRPVARGVAQRAAGQQGHHHRRGVHRDQQRDVQRGQVEHVLVARVQRGGQVGPGEQHDQRVAQPGEPEPPGRGPGGWRLRAGGGTRRGRAGQLRVGHVCCSLVGGPSLHSKRVDRQPSGCLR